MIFRSYTAWLVPLTLTLVGFGSGATKATAQTTYPFEDTYNTVTTFSLLTQSAAGIVLEANVTGESADAPYGLTNIQIKNYASVDPDTGVFTIGPDPAAFGLEGLPPLDTTITLFGNGNDQLFGINSGTSPFGDTGSGTITLTGGKGRFIGASGTLDWLSNNLSGPDPSGLTAPIEAEFTISGSFQTVPEPGTGIGTLVGIGAGVGLLLHSRRNSRKRAV